MSKHKFVLSLLLLVLVARLISLPLYPLLDKTEARYAYIADLVLQTGDWITPFVDHGVPFWAKPMPSFWLTALSLAALGHNEFAARFPSFLILVALTWLLFEVGRSERGTQFGLIAACVYSSSALGFYFGGTVMTDPALLLGVTLTMVSFWKSINKPKTGCEAWRYLFFVGLAIGLLSKGPIGAVLPGISIFIWVVFQSKWNDLWRRLPWLTGMALVLVLVLPWYVAAEMRTPGFLHYFLVGEHIERFLVPHWEGSLYEPGRPHPKGIIWLFVVVAALPWSIVLLFLCFRQKHRDFWQAATWILHPWPFYLLCWIVAPIVLFTFASNILLTYAATSIPALSLLAAEAIQTDDISEPDYRFAIVTLLVPALFLILIAFADPKADYLRSQAGIVATFTALTKGTDSELIYVLNRPYSADFYTRGRAKRIADLDSIPSGDPNYYVVASDLYSGLSTELRGRFRVVEKRNHHILLRPQ